MEGLYILVIMQYLFKKKINVFFLIFTRLQLYLWFSHVNSTIPVITAVLYILCFKKLKGITVGEKKKKKKGRLGL